MILMRASLESGVYIGNNFPYRVVYQSWITSATTSEVQNFERTHQTTTMDLQFNEETKVCRVCSLRLSD